MYLDDDNVHALKFINITAKIWYLLHNNYYYFYKTDLPKMNSLQPTYVDIFLGKVSLICERLEALSYQ